MAKKHKTLPFKSEGRNSYFIQNQLSSVITCILKGNRMEKTAAPVTDQELSPSHNTTKSKKKGFCNISVKKALHSIFIAVIQCWRRIQTAAQLGVLYGLYIKDIFNLNCNCCYNPYNQRYELDSALLTRRNQQY